ncbi:MAG TPA: serine hydrolase [Bryobacteraceae bacterium]|nr:serine hydrolase [Bryobacteraceae bacterium]
MKLTSRRILVCAFMVAGIVAAPIFRTRAQVSSAVYPGAEWDVSTPEAEGMDPVKFADALAGMPDRAIVVRHGKIIGSKGDIARSGPIYSASKSLLSVLAGTLLQRNLITLDMIVPGSAHPEPPPASFRHFLTMTADFRLEPHSPGHHYAYSNSGAIHYGNYMFATFFPGKDEVDALREAFLSKLGAQDPMSMVGSVSGWGGGGFVMSTRDLARVGYLVLRGGNWNGEQLLPAAYVDSLYASQIPDSASQGGSGTGQVDNQEDATVKLPGSYSYGFWLPHGQKGRDGSGSSVIGTSASGAYGTSMHIIPEYDLVLASVNSAETMDGGKIPEKVIDMMAAAVVDNGSSTVGTATRPVVAAVVNGASWRPAVAPGSWFSVMGENLAADARLWRNSEIVASRLPESLDGVRVLVGGKPAFVQYVSPHQINAQAPDSAVEGPVDVQVVRGGFTSNAFQVEQRLAAPALFQYMPSPYVAARHADFRLLGPSDLWPECAGQECPPSPAASGEIVLLYGTGFGRTAPETPSGRITAACEQAPCRVTQPVRVRFGTIWVDAEAALSSAGLYQVNVAVPHGIDGDVPLVVAVGGSLTQEGVLIRVSGGR